MLAKQSLKYARKQHSGSSNTRRLQPKWFTAANYLRVFAAVIMRGLLSSRSDPEFFDGIETCGGRYTQTGAKDVLGITLNQYQQLIRYMHLVDNAKKISPSAADFDKLFLLRPLITKLQSAFARWMVPGKNDAVDEVGIPSRHRWMRTFNPSKPTKYFIEILMGCDSVSKFCWAFIVTETASKTIINRHRKAKGPKKSKYIKVTHYQREYNEMERQLQNRFGSSTAQMCYFARLLRERYPSDITYRIFTDRRWDSLPAIILSKMRCNVSFTTTVKVSSRYHVIQHWTKKGAGKTLTKSKKKPEGANIAVLVQRYRASN